MLAALAGLEQRRTGLAFWQPEIDAQTRAARSGQKGHAFDAEIRRNRAQAQRQIGVERRSARRPRGARSASATRSANRNPAPALAHIDVGRIARGPDVSRAEPFAKPRSCRGRSPAASTNSAEAERGKCAGAVANAKVRYRSSSARPALFAGRQRRAGNTPSSAGATGQVSSAGPRTTTAQPASAAWMAAMPRRAQRSAWRARPSLAP